MPIVIALETLGSAAIIVGWKIRFFTFFPAGFCFLFAIIFHSNFTGQMQIIIFVKNVSIIVWLLFLIAHGAGKYSLYNSKQG